MLTFFTTQQGKALILAYIVITCLTLPPTLYVIIEYRKEKLDLGEMFSVWLLGAFFTLFAEGVLFMIYETCLEIVIKNNF